MGSNSLCITPFVYLSNHRRPRNPVSTKIFSARGSVNDDPNCDCDDSGGRSRRRRLVDENMIVLRKRIHEMKMIERNYEPPADWMEWEKRYFTSYDSIICDALGVLQTGLMNTRPSFALGFVALIMLSLPTSAGFVFLHAVEITKRIVEAGVHVINGKGW